jgi:hypothetical protein
MALSTIAEESDEQVDLILETQLDTATEPRFDHEDQICLSAPSLCNDSLIPKTTRVLDSVVPLPTNTRGPTSYGEHLFCDLFTRPKSSGKDPLTGFHFAPFVRPVINMSRDKKQLAQSPLVGSAQAQQSLEALGKAVLIVLASESSLTTCFRLER